MGPQSARQNKPHTTRYNYELAVTQLAEFLTGPDLPDFLAVTGMDPHDDSDAAQDPTDVDRKHIDWFITWMIDTRSPATALNKYKCIQQFYKYLIDEDELERHPMAKLTQPNQPGKLVPIVRDDELAALLATCNGKTFLDRRDTAIIRLLLDSGGRLTEITTLPLDSLNLSRDLVTVRGKGDQQRTIPFGERTGQALTRYLRIRSRHAGANLPDLFLAARGRTPVKPNGVKIMLKRRGELAGIPHMHAHRLRHTLAHTWQLEHGNESDLMAIMGWKSPEMLRHYGKSAAAERAQNTHRTMRLGNRI